MSIPNPQAGRIETTTRARGKSWLSRRLCSATPVAEHFCTSSDSLVAGTPRARQMDSNHLRVINASKTIRHNIRAYADTSSRANPSSDFCFSQSRRVLHTRFTFAFRSLKTLSIRLTLTILARSTTLLTAARCKRRDTRPPWQGFMSLA